MLRKRKARPKFHELSIRTEQFGGRWGGGFIRNDGRITRVNGVSDLRGDGVDDIVQVFDESVELLEGGRRRPFLGSGHSADGGREWASDNTKLRAADKFTTVILVVTPSGDESSTVFNSSNRLDENELVSS